MIRRRYLCPKCHSKFYFDWDDSAESEFCIMGTSKAPCPECGTISDRIIHIYHGVVKNKGNIPIRSKGYKEGYSKEYLRDVQPEKYA